MLEQHDIPDAPACPLLGLLDDRRSHFTYPHRQHRCYAGGHPKRVDVARQTSYCLAFDFAACDRFRAWTNSAAGRAAAAETAGARVTANNGASASQSGPTLVHVARESDSLGGLAGRYGLAVEDLASANDLAVDADLVPGQRLRIPISTAPSEARAMGRADPSRVG